MSRTDPLQRYQIRNRISAGGMATVYLAYDQVLRRDVALKMLHPFLLDQAETVQRFSNEARAIATLCHENIIKIYDFGETASGPFLVMEYVDGSTLQELLLAKNILPNLVALEIIRQIASGLSCAHKNGIFHRDIKPANILIDKNGTIRITDFGIAFLLNSESITMTGTFVGSPHYISPEQAEGKPLQGTTDIFSLGICLYQCLTGRLPFDAETPHAVIHSIIHDFPDDLLTYNNSVVFWLEDLVKQCLTKSPDDRMDSEQVLDFINTRCTTDAIKLNRTRISAFMSSAEMYRSGEQRELFELYRDRAIEDFREKRLVSGLRRFEQANLFGELSPEDIKLRTRVLRGRKFRHAAIAVPCILLFSIISIIILKTVVISESRPKEVLFGQEMHDTSSSETEVVQTTFAPSHGTTPEIKEVMADVREPIVSEPPAPKEISVHRPLIKRNTDAVISKKPGVCNIFTNPPWVMIYIDGIERGKTPRVNSFILTPGDHELMLKKRGFHVHTSRFSVTSEDTVTLRIRLTPDNQDISSP